MEGSVLNCRALDPGTVAESTLLPNQLLDDNDRPVRRLGKSRYQLFEEIERPARAPLPVSSPNSNVDERLDIAFEAVRAAGAPAHQLIALEHEARLLTPEAFGQSPRVRRSTTGMMRLPLQATQRPERHALDIKSRSNSTSKALSRVRQRLITARTAVINAVQRLPR